MGYTVYYSIDSDSNKAGLALAKTYTPEQNVKTSKDLERLCEIFSVPVTHLESWDEYDTYLDSSLYNAEDVELVRDGAHGIYIKDSDQFSIRGQHESFDGKFEVEEEGYGLFECCKTNCKTYDILIKLAYLILEKNVGVPGVSHDGDIKDYIMGEWESIATEDRASVVRAIKEFNLEPALDHHGIETPDDLIEDPLNFLEIEDAMYPCF